jgi:hypothetical protein
MQSFRKQEIRLAYFCFGISFLLLIALLMKWMRG